MHFCITVITLLMECLAIANAFAFPNPFNGLFIRASDPTDALDLDVSDRYIVTLKPNVNVTAHVEFVQHTHSKTVTERDGTTFRGVTHQYDLAGFHGYAGHFARSTIHHLKENADIDTIEPDQIWTSAGGMVTQANAPYALSLISHREPEKANTPQYVFDETGGTNTFAYVVGSGINIQHRDFEHRAKLGYNAIKPNAVFWNDDFGLGTHIAGIIGSKTYGVAKKCNLIAVKVTRNEQGVLSQILDGYAWAVKDVVEKKRQAKAVINPTLYVGSSPGYTRAIEQASAKGITTVLPAGDNDRNVPVSGGLKSSAIVVSATDSSRNKAPFANYGPTVDLWAPGTRIRSTYKGRNTAVAAGTGTAQASGFVAGLAVYFKSLNDLPHASATKRFILKQALPNQVPVPPIPKEPFAYNGSGK